MKLRTELEIQEYLDADFGWRVREIDYAQNAIRQASGSAQVTLTRAGIALLYAHWEGFVKGAAEALLNFVRHRRLKYRQLRSCFVAHGIAGHLEILSSSRSHHRRAEAVTFIVGKLDEEALFPWKDVIRTHNLRSEAFRGIAAAVAVDPARYESRYHWIDKELVDLRNKVAHGEKLELLPSKFPTLAQETLTLLRWFKTDVENVVATKSYMDSAKAGS